MTDFWNDPLIGMVVRYQEAKDAIGIEVAKPSRRKAARPKAKARAEGIAQ